MAAAPAGDRDAKRSISTGNIELDKKMGGGIPTGSLTLIEGQSDAGKSVLVQQLAWGGPAGWLPGALLHHGEHRPKPAHADDGPRAGH